MLIKATMKPGQKGTMRYLQHYGESLVCVRYRYDEQKQKCYTTVELIIDEQAWFPGTNTLSQHKDAFIKVGYEETRLRQRVKQAGGHWDAQKKSWRLPLNTILKMKLEHRIVREK